MPALSTCEERARDALLCRQHAKQAGFVPTPTYAARAVSDPTPLPFFARVGLAFALFFRVLFDGRLARRAQGLFESGPALPPAAPPAKAEPEKATRDFSPALQLLSLLQRQGRLVDFLRQDVADFSDEDIGVAARVVHDGCRKTLEQHLSLEPVRSEDEGAQIRVEAPIDAAAIKLVGNVSGSGPYSGVLRHRGWRATRIELPDLVGEHDPKLLAPAELEV